MNKKKEMNFNINNFLLATKDILDAREIREKNLTKNHSLRVAFISLQMANKLDYEPKEMFDLCAYSLFHNYIDNEKMELLNINNEKNKLSKLVTFVHQLEEKYDFGNISIIDRSKLVNSIQEVNIDKNIINVFTEITQPLSFWLDCQNTDSMIQFIYKNLYDFTVVLPFPNLLKITSMFGNLYENTEVLLNNCKKACEYFQFEYKDTYTFLIAASMIDFGKLAIEKELLTKKEKLTFTEFEIIKSNIYYNKNALSSIYGFDDISKWASRHQETIDGAGYPSKLLAKDLSLKDRLISILHKYSILLQNRTYRDQFSSKEAIMILEKEAQNNKLDKALLEEVKNFVY